MVHIHPPALNVTTHHLDFAVGWVAISRAQLVECGNAPVTVLIFALSRGENLFAGCILEVIDVRLVDIKLEKQPAGLARYGADPRACRHRLRADRGDGRRALRAPADELISLTQTLLEVPVELVETALGLELEGGAVIADDLEGRLSGEEGDRMTPSLASNDFHGSKHPNGQSKTAEATVVEQQFDSVWARVAVAAREEPKETLCWWKPDSKVLLLDHRSLGGLALAVWMF